MGRPRNNQPYIARTFAIDVKTLIRLDRECKKLKTNRSRFLSGVLEGYLAFLDILWLRLNHPILQTVNYLLGAVQLALIVVYVRIGEFIWRAPAIPLSIPQLVRTFKADPLAFLRQFAWTGVHAATAWLVTAPILIFVIYHLVRPVLRRFSVSKPSESSPSVE